MSLSVQNNVAAMNAYRNLATTQNNLSSSLEKLSSGFRINRAADDAAGLAISEGLRSQVGGLNVAIRNAQDGISVVQTAEGALTETHAILQRMRDLSVQAANTGGLSQGAKENIQAEIDELAAGLTDIANQTQFNGTNLLNGSYEGTFQVGANVGEVIDVSIARELEGGLSAAGLGVNDLRVAGEVTVAGFSAAAVAPVTDGSATADATVTINGTEITLAEVDGSDNLAAVDMDGIAAAINAAGLSGVSASVDDGNLLISNSAGEALTVAWTGATATADANLDVAGVPANANDAITRIDEAIATVSTVRAELGAKQNRLDHTINSLQVSAENLTASESRIRDTDMANEMVAYTSANILQQAGTAMLAQANQLPQSVLSLLR